MRNHVATAAPGCPQSNAPELCAVDRPP